MREQGEKFLDVDDKDGVMSGSTDQGNVSHARPALHAIVANNHTHEFALASGETAAHEMMLKAGKAMAMMGWALLTDDQFYARVSDAHRE